jgi:hypothetical protein
MPFVMSRIRVNPIRNSSPAKAGLETEQGIINPAGNYSKIQPRYGGTAEQRRIISNGVNALETGITYPKRFFRIGLRLFLLLLLLLKECFE